MQKKKIPVGAWYLSYGGSEP